MRSFKTEYHSSKKKNTKTSFYHTSRNDYFKKLCLTRNWKGTTLVCKSQGTWGKFLYSIYGCEGNMTPDNNPKCFGMERYCLIDMKNVSFADMCL